MRLILTEFGLGLAKEQLLNMYKHATAKKFNFLFVDMEEESEKRFRHNFLTVLDPTQFAKEAIGERVTPEPTENVVLSIRESPKPKKSLQEKLEDVASLRVDLLDDLTKSKLTDHLNAQEIVTHLSDLEIRKVSQNLPKIQKDLGKHFSLGVPSDKFLEYVLEEL